MEKGHTEAVSRLYRAILTLHTEEECRRFFDDICTVKEIQDLAQRLEVASMLSAGKNYQEISRETGASTATICRVNKCLLYGDGGYKTVLSRIDQKGETQNDPV